MLPLLFALMLTKLTFAAHHETVDAVVDAGYTGEAGAVVDGAPTFATLTAAIEAAPDAAQAPHRIFVRRGRYHEKLNVEKPNIHLTGEDRDATVITYDDYAGRIGPNGKTLGTRRSYTMRVAAPDFRAENLTIENAFDYHANRVKDRDDPTRVRGSQGVALLTAEASDRAVFVNCKLLGHQDTLFSNAGRQYYERCVIAGSVDFIFGAGVCVFYDCDIVSRDRFSDNNGYITAPSSHLAQPFGLLFLDCRLKKERAEMKPNSVALGRPWHPSGRRTAVGSAIFIRCEMDDHISDQGWTTMGGFRPEDARMFEFGSTGPGARTSDTRPRLTDAQAAAYTIEAAFHGWSPN